MSIARYMYSLYSEHSEVVKEAFIRVEKRETEQLTLPYYLLFPGESCVLLILYSSTKLILRYEHSSFKQFLLALHGLFSTVKVSCLERAASRLTVQ